MGWSQVSFLPQTNLPLTLPLRNRRFIRTGLVPLRRTSALDQCHALVKRDPARQTLATKAAISADDQLLLGDVFQRLADQRRNVLRRLNYRVAMVDNADADLLVGSDVLEQMQVLPI